MWGGAGNQKKNTYKLHSEKRGRAPNYYYYYNGDGINLHKPQAPK